MAKQQTGEGRLGVPSAATNARSAGKSLVAGNGRPAAPRKGRNTTRRNTTRRNTTKGAARARQIMEVAEQMFQERGYAETSMDDIAQAVGLLKGSLYYYMNSKEDLLYRIVDDVHEEVQARLDDVITQEGVPALKRLLTFVQEQIMYNATHVPRIAVYHHEWLRLEGERLDEVLRRRRQQELLVIRLIEEAKDEGDIPKDLDAKLAAASVFAITIWPYTWYRPGIVSPSRLASFCVDFVLNGLRGNR